MKKQASITVLICSALLVLTNPVNAEKLFYACDGWRSVFPEKTDSFHTEYLYRKPFILVVDDWSSIEYTNYMGDPAEKVYLGAYNPWKFIFFNNPGFGVGLVSIQKSGGSSLTDINEEIIKFQEIMISVENTPFSNCYLND